jgi:hypothetical protein
MTSPVSTLPSGCAVMRPYRMPLLTRGKVTSRLAARAARRATLLDVPQVLGDLVGQHLDEPEAEQVRRVAAVPVQSARHRLEPRSRRAWHSGFPQFGRGSIKLAVLFRDPWDPE